ncbi:MAG: hypothetical protein M1830_000792 [Pleopsidium flavum]|nr:MAG: hypothetical protein M1830_000792 [Pleopsidium flavum]
MTPSMTCTVLAAAVAVMISQSLVAAQTYSNCNPLSSGACPPDSALGKSVNIDFTRGASDSFTAQGNPTYDSNGVSFTVAKSGDSPQLTSKWYIMFGHVEFVVKAAPGVGIVSSVVLESDDLDEIDWEWLGADGSQVQTNYFGKGQTTTYNRGAFHPDPNNQNGFHKYTIDWTSDQIVWQIDGVTVRALTQANAQGQYPQTPMQLKFGAWSGGDPSNAPGTIQWAGGSTNYAGGPYTMQVKSIAVTDYSTGTQYTYSGTSGNWQSIQAAGGKVNPNGGSGASPADYSAPAVTASSNSAPIPFEGTHRDSSSTYSQPNVYPWVAGATTLQTSTTAAATTYPGLPSGWTVSNSGKVIPPSAASPTSPPGSFTAALPSSPASSAAEGFEVVTRYDQQGFPVTVTAAIAASTATKSYDQQGFLITAGPTPASAPGSTVTDMKAADSAQSSSNQLLRTSVTGAASPRNVARGLGAACGLIGGALIL